MNILSSWSPDCRPAQVIHNMATRRTVPGVRPLCLISGKSDNFSLPQFSQLWMGLMVMPSLCHCVRIKDDIECKALSVFSKILAIIVLDCFSGIFRDSQLKYLLLSGHLTGSVRGTYSSWSWGCAFKPHNGYRDCLKNKNLLKIVFHYLVGNSWTTSSTVIGVRVGQWLDSTNNT